MSETAATGEGRPIKQVLAELATSGSAPVAPLKECMGRSSETVPVLRDLVALAAVEWPDDDQATLLHRGLYILASARDRATFKPLVRLLRRYPEELLSLFDNTFYGLLRIIHSVFDGDGEALLTIVVERDASQVARAIALWAASQLALLGRIPRDLLARVMEEIEGEDPVGGETFWKTARMLGRGAITEIDSIGHWSEPDSGDEAGEKGERDGERHEQDEEDTGRVKDFRDSLKYLRLGGIRDVILSLGWDVFEQEEKTSRMEMGGKAGLRRKVTDSWRNVGRNDPCPCGSGRKTKKCCWDKRDGW